ncbi:MAG TPA: N-acetylmuramoyl-L-alanine amidase [Puia sp.]|nr:N-acetylmuramoyl-L-alanine amidase [Puia sp.]
MRSIVVYTLFLLIASSAWSQDSIWLARTTGRFPFMEYGIGDDRLGGAKMGYLDSNILVKIVDSFNTDYKVRLSAGHSAYIAKTSVVLLNKQAARPLIHNTHLTGNMKVYGDSAFDYVAITLDERLPYHSFQLTDPSRISIDIFGVTSNTNWITQFRNTREIKNTWYDQVEDDVMRVTIQLRHVQHWGHSLSYDSSGKRLIVRIKRQPAVLDIRRLRIAVDAGHGGDNIGASGGTSKILEKDYTLLIAKELQKTLKKLGVKKVFMTREKDTSLSMPERMEMLSAFNPDLLVSIHLNSAGIDTVQGTSTYYRYIGFRPLSLAILNQMLTLGLKEYGNVGSFNFALSGPTEYPNALVEVAFLSNPADEKKILNPKFHKAVAQKIYLGITDWLKQSK